MEFERDLPRLSKEKTEKIILYVCEYIYLGSEKNYFTDNNIADVLRQLCNGIEKFEALESETVFGEWIGVRGYGRLQINPNLEDWLTIWNQSYQQLGAEYLTEISELFSNLVNNHPKLTKEIVDYL